MRAFEELHFRDLHKGDVVYEDGCVFVKVATEPVKSGDDWSFTGRTGFGDIAYFMTDFAPQYRPKLYREDFRAFAEGASK